MTTRKPTIPRTTTPPPPRAEPIRRPTRATLTRARLVATATLPRRTRRPARPAPADGPRLDLVAANLERGVRDPVGQARALVALEVGVLALTEHSPTTSRALDEAGLRDAFPHLVEDVDDDGYFGSLVASRHPLVAAERRDIGGRRGQVVTLDVGGTHVRLVPVHTQAPIHDRDVQVWHSTLTANAALALEAPGPLVLAGDWNATGGHRHLRRTLADHDLADAAEVLGRRAPRTWPVGVRLLGLRVRPLLPLDHVVLSADVGVETLEATALPGSDHLGLRAVLRLPGGGSVNRSRC